MFVRRYSQRDHGDGGKVKSPGKFELDQAYSSRYSCMLS
jgi:hypothetical protein